MKSFVKAAPESVGIPSQALYKLMQRLSKLEYINSIMLLRHGKLCLEAWMKPYERNMPHQLFSLSKSFTSCAIGIAQGEGLLSIHDKLVKFFPEYLDC
ncbi:MAG: serine hydrolase, partial [Lentisphaeria bacterium]|nr:serine hydrolase [Lentisphaeria bacterium]